MEARGQLTVDDLVFIATTLSSSKRVYGYILDSVFDKDTRYSVLDNPLLYEKIQEARPPHISCYLFCYLKLRYVLTQNGFHGIDLAHFLASAIQDVGSQLLIGTDTDMWCSPDAYVYDLYAELMHTNDENAFLLGVALGNYVLTFAGLFPDKTQKIFLKEDITQEFIEEGIQGYQYAMECCEEANRMDMVPLLMEVKKNFRTLKDVVSKAFSTDEENPTCLSSEIPFPL